MGLAFGLALSHEETMEIPLRAGTSTPQFVEDTLLVFGRNPHGEPNFRLIWSERKEMWFTGEVLPEYSYLPTPCWVLEKWLDPVKFAGSEATWGVIQKALMGPYPRKGTFNFVQAYPTDWGPSAESVRLLATGIQMSLDIEMKVRERAIRENLEEIGRIARQKVADEIVEMQDSASLGKIQQAASGPKNTFRTTDDFQRDNERVAPANFNLPKSGGKIMNQENA